MKRNFGLKKRSPNPSPNYWLLFYLVFLLAMIAAASRGHAADLDERQSFITQFSCAKLREYLADHSEAEARAKAEELHLPRWLIRKAEKCAKPN